MTISPQSYVTKAWTLKFFRADIGYIIWAYTH